MPIVDIMENKVFGPLIRKGIELGRQEAREEARKERVAVMLDVLLREQFQHLPEWVPERIAAASEADLMRWTIRVIHASSIEGVFAD